MTMAFREDSDQVVERGAGEITPPPTGRLHYKVVDEAALLRAYEQHLRLMEDRQKATVQTYTSHVKALCRWLAETHPSVMLADVTRFQVRAFLLQEANRGLKPCTRSNELFAIRSFYRFLIAEGLSEENPAALVTLPSPVRPRVEFYSDPEADAIIEWAAAQPGLRWQVGRVILLTLRYTGLRAERNGDPDAARRSTLTLGEYRSSARVASLGWSPFPTCWRTCSAST